MARLITFSPSATKSPCTDSRLRRRRTSVSATKSARRGSLASSTSTRLATTPSLAGRRADHAGRKTGKSCDLPPMVRYIALKSVRRAACAWRAASPPGNNSMTLRRATRWTSGRRGRRRRVKTGALVGVAVVIATMLMVTLTAQAIVSGASCQNHPVLVNVAVTNDLAPAVERVAQLFNRQRHAAGGSCAQIQVTQGQSAALAGQIDGQHAVPGLPPIDAWVPDSSLWVDIARRFPVGARAVQPTGVDIARSPLMLVMPESAAAKVPAFGSSVGWDFLLPPSVGGPPAAVGLRVD